MTISRKHLIIFASLALAIWVSLCRSNSRIANAEIISSSTENLTLFPFQENSSQAETLQTARQALAENKPEQALGELQRFENAENLVHPSILFAELCYEIQLADQALSSLNELSVAEPDRLDLYMAFCEIAIQQGRWFDAWSLASISNSKLPDPDWSGDFEKRVRRRLLLLKGIACEGRQDWAGAKQTYRELLSEKSAEVLTGLARANFHLEEIDEARKLFSEYVTLHSQGSHADLFIARLYASVQDKSNAISSYEVCLEQLDKAQKGQIFIEFANYLLNNNLVAEAANLLKDKESFASEIELERQYLLSVIDRALHHLEDAQKKLTSLHQKEPTSFVIGNQLALVLIESDSEGLRARAQQIAESHVQNYSSSPVAWSTLGWTYFKLGNLAAAEQALAQSLNLGPASNETLYYLAQFKLSQGLDDQAEELLDTYRNSNGIKFRQIDE